MYFTRGMKSGCPGCNEIRCFPPLPEKHRQGWGTRRFAALSVRDIKPELVVTAAAAGERMTGECEALKQVF